VVAGFGARRAINEKSRRPAMARVRFHRAFDYRPRSGVVLAYKPGEYTVRRECADRAIAAGAAQEVNPPPALRAAPRRRVRKDPV
jgi:hypothetical protein